MDNLFNPPTYQEIKTRIQNLKSTSTPEWGKMDVAQMLAHCRKSFKIALSKEKLPRTFIGIFIGPLFKKQLYNDKPWKRNLPTAPFLKVVDQRDFEVEKEGLLKSVDEFYNAGPDGIYKYAHPVFGKFTPEQWGQSMYKHLNHHLDQFGV